MGSKSRNQTMYIVAAVAVIIIVIGLIMWMKSSNDKKGDVVQKAKEHHPPPPQQNVQDHETKLDDQPSFDPSKPTIVMFYATWCGPSRAALPEWQKLESALKGSPVQSISFEDSTSKDEIMKNGVKGYPTIRLYPEGYPNMNFIEYNGPRVFENLFQFVKSGGKS